MEEIKPTLKKKKEQESVFETENSTPEKAIKAPREKKAIIKRTNEDSPDSTYGKWWNDGRLLKISGLSLMLTSFILLVS